MMVFDYNVITGMSYNGWVDTPVKAETKDNSEMRKKAEILTKSLSMLKMYISCRH